MKSFWLIVLGIVLVALGLTGLLVNRAHALTLEWDRNSEPDMKDYGVFACFTPGCSVVMTAGTRIGTVGQTPTGIKPTWPIAPNTQGAVAVTARDMALNESGLSVSVFFDAVAPSIPVNPVLK